MSMAVWLRVGRPDVLGHRAAPGFLLPGIGAACGLAVLLIGSMHSISPVAVALAAATLVVVGVRLALSVRSLRTLTEERHRQAVTDQLTGLGNRRRLAQVLESFFADHENAATAARDLAFLFVDLNHFKEINDSFGHPAGDQLLTQIGPRIETCLGESDLLVRIGGDELAVILVDSDRDRAARVAERLSATLHDPFVLDMVSVRIGASIGIAIAPDHATDAEELMRCADRAMYRSKRAGTPFEIHDARLDSEADRLRLVEELRTAIEEHQFELHYQPQINLRDGTISAVEALLRWPHPRLGIHPAARLSAPRRGGGADAGADDHGARPGARPVRAMAGGRSPALRLGQRLGDEHSGRRLHRPDPPAAAAPPPALERARARDHRDDDHLGLRTLQARGRRAVRARLRRFDRRLRRGLHLASRTSAG